MISEYTVSPLAIWLIFLIFLSPSPSRRLDAVEYTVQQNAGKVVIENEYFRITYHGGAFEYGNIKIECGKKGKFRSWMPGISASMQPGTARTLDGVNGETELENSCKRYNKVYRISPIKYTGFRHKVYKFSP